MAEDNGYPFGILAVVAIVSVVGIVALSMNVGKTAYMQPSTDVIYPTTLGDGVVGDAENIGSQAKLSIDNCRMWGSEWHCTDNIPTAYCGMCARISNK